MKRRKYVQEAVDSLPRAIGRPIKKVASYVPPRFVHGSKYVERRKFLKESQWWSEEKLREYQEDRLKDLLEHAYKNVPYYRRIFNDRGLKPSDIETVEDLSLLPTLTKEDITENFDDLQARNIQDTITSGTSGSTGEPLKFKEPSYAEQIERAYTNRAFQSHGTDLYHEKVVLIRSYSPGKNDPYYKYDPQLNILFLSPFHLSPDTIGDYVDRIKAYGANTLVGYPSSAYIFATLFEETEESLPNIDVVHTGSENLHSEWRDRIESALDVPVKDEYGMAEKVSKFHQCSESDAYHENLEYGITEVIDRSNGTGELVGTSLWNYAMPLIRYRMGDKATVNTGNTTCSCGRGLPLTVERFEGRTDDILRTPDGRQLPGVNFYTMMYKVPGLDMFKITQTALDHIEVQIVVSEKFDEVSKKELKEGLVQRLGAEMTIEIQCVDMIQRDWESEKIRCIETRID